MRATTWARRLGVAALALLPAVALAGPATAAPNADRTLWAHRAQASYQALQDNLYLGDAGHRLYAESTPAAGGNPYSYLWEFREATQATLGVRGLPGGQRYAGDVADRFAALGQYASPDPAHPGYESYLPAPLGGGGDLFYDDNAVVGLSFVDSYRSGGGAGALAGAEAAFRTDLRAWDSDPAKTCPGGMHWVEADWNTIRAANVTGLFAELAANLYATTRDRSYLDWAVRAYEWNRSCLMSSPGLYRNDIADDGTYDQTLWTYNSGAMIGTATVLYRATGDRRWRDLALGDARGAMAYWTADRLYSQPAIFNAFLFRDVLALDPAYRSTLDTYAARLWQDNRDPATGLFRFQASNGGAPDPAQPVNTLNQAAAVQLFALLGNA
ncbi:glycoside hydrolase family 76 protein [Actinocatenispora rupis]|uniref:Hydrolase n=1 Tax=Actinocatenispora rupis TaxID=519421 RepID=A0A8J3IWT6_9ACTN|nr:glycoside hydrolase family 76 protein [Actinocatenispora rupis]GID10095.1 hydrolase [Actinocatenispora rupis]